MLLTEDNIRLVPEGLETNLAATAEPMGVGFGYVRNARLTAEDMPLVVGCGAIGLAMISALKLTDARPIVASDYSAKRRELAAQAGADVVVDPAQTSPYEPHNGRTPNVIFECVGVRGVLDQIVRACPTGARIIAPGWCLEPDYMLTVCAHTKGLNVQYGGAPKPQDFREALRCLAEGLVDTRPWIGRSFGLSSVAEELAKVGDPVNPIRTFVDPRKD
jgi:threonine dehydrogenase-like Zn-dependent dehydrogenase